MKQKTNKSALKRVITTGGGELRRRNLSAQHLVSGKSKRTLKKSKQTQTFAKADMKRIKKLVPFR
ncbi:MAG TPA: 50S ribosomal protein L35 [Patescibacteria group bacterium]|nr:50S ribosomal protein L35 [Patescibacteria group bacterium]